MWRKLFLVHILDKCNFLLLLCFSILFTSLYNHFEHISKIEKGKKKIFKKVLLATLIY